MRADNTGHLVEAARRRRELTRAKAIQAIRELDRVGSPVTFEAVARVGGISRSWLYAHNDIRAEIDRLRDVTRPRSSASIPASQRASDDSLRQRLQQAHDRNKKLAEENARLRRQLEHALGDRRTSPRPADATQSSESSGRDSITTQANEPAQNDPG